jgi:hypothetical protein
MVRQEGTQPLHRAAELVEQQVKPAGRIKGGDAQDDGE